MSKNLTLEERNKLASEEIKEKERAFKESYRTSSGTKANIPQDMLALSMTYAIRDIRKKYSL